MASLFLKIYGNITHSLLLLYQIALVSVTILYEEPNGGQIELEKEIILFPVSGLRCYYNDTWLSITSWRERAKVSSFECFTRVWCSVGKGVLFKTFDIKVKVQNVPELWRQTFWEFSFSYGASHIIIIWQADMKLKHE